MIQGGLQAALFLASLVADQHLWLAMPLALNCGEYSLSYAHVYRFRGMPS